MDEMADIAPFSVFSGGNANPFGRPIAVSPAMGEVASLFCFNLRSILRANGSTNWDWIFWCVLMAESESLKLREGGDERLGKSEDINEDGGG